MSTLAVFSRNYEKYLEEACQIAAEAPDRLVPFQSEKPWVSAQKALREHQTLKIYITPMVAHAGVRYEATLARIVLDPLPSDPLLDLSLQGTIKEGLWKKTKTLYAIANCRRYPIDRRLSDFRVAKDGRPLSDQYSRSYALVRELDESSLAGLPEEVPQDVIYPEGAVISMSVNPYERNNAARQACVALYGLNCTVCGLNFEARYGKVGAGFIHVHHLTPLSKIKVGYQVDPKQDLRPVCPNCHAMLHRGDLKIDELRELMCLIESN